MANANPLSSFLVVAAAGGVIRFAGRYVHGSVRSLSKLQIGCSAVLVIGFVVVGFVVSKPFGANPFFALIHGAVATVNLKAPFQVGDGLGEILFVHSKYRLSSGCLS